MNIRAAILCSHLLFALPLFARESTDVIVMRNGDHLTGDDQSSEWWRALRRPALRHRDPLRRLVEGGPPREQAVVSCQDRGRLGLQRDPQQQ